MSAPTAPAGEADQTELQRARGLLSATAIRALAEDRWRRWRPWLDGPVFLVLLVGLTLLFAPPQQSKRPIPPLDSIASETVRAERALAVEDRAVTEAKRQSAVAATPPVFDYDADLYLRLGKAVATAVDDVVGRANDDSLGPAQRRAAFQEALGRPVPQAIYDLIEGLESPGDLAIAISYLLNLGLDRMVVADRADLPLDGTIGVHDLVRDRMERALVPGIMDLAQYRRLIQARAADTPFGSARVVRSFVVETALALAAPNLTANPGLTEKLRAEAAARVEPAMVRIDVGEVVIREGDRVTPSIQDRLRLLNEGGARRSVIWETLAIGVLLAGLLVLAGQFFRDGHNRQRLARKQIYMTLGAVAVTGVVSIAAWYGARGVAAGMGLPSDAAAFLPPVALTTVVVALLIDARTSLLAGVVLTVMISYRVDGDLWVMIHYLIGVLAAGLSARRARRRSDVLKTALVIAAAQLAFVPVMVALDTTVPAAAVSYFIAVAATGFISALLIAALTAAMLPLIEWLFDETTDLRLLELASADNPLLKQLALRSPGTYYHSMMMANLAEAAAEAIGANGLQCRVMALYHDLGKMERPSYFVENQRGGNIHDRLPPELSARIIFAHIKDGIDIARRHRLGRPVLDAVTQHQGTTLLRVFYQRAVDRAKATGEPVNDAEFRYPGPRPMTRESGILMLADSIEAATRALKDPKPADVRERVASVIRDKIADHQLDDCALTMKDLASVEATFVRVLTLGVYHNRIEYPPLPAKDAKIEAASQKAHDPAAPAAKPPGETVPAAAPTQDVAATPPRDPRKPGLAGGSA